MFGGYLVGTCDVHGPGDHAMPLELLKTSERPLRVIVTKTDEQTFALASFLVVSRDGNLIWEFIRDDFQACEMEEGFELSAVLTDEFTGLLQQEVPAQMRKTVDLSVKYEVTYGVIPSGYKQTIPDSGSPPALSPGEYRVLAFSSAGSGAVVVRV